MEQRSARPWPSSSASRCPSTPSASPAILDEVVARVAAIEPAGPGLASRCASTWPPSTIGADLAQLLNMAFGNCSLQPDVELLDLDLDPAAPPPPQPAPATASRGCGGWSEQRTGAPLTCTALKPQGPAPTSWPALAATFARGRHRPGQGRPRPGRPVRRPLRPPGGRLPGGGGGRQPAQRRAPPATRRAWSAGPASSPARPASPGRRASRWCWWRRCWSDCPASPSCSSSRADLGPGPAVRPGGPGPPGPRRRGRMAPAAADRQAVPPGRRGRGDLPPPRRPLLLHAGRLRGHGPGHLRRPWGGLRPSLPVPAGGMTTERVERDGPLIRARRAAAGGRRVAPGRRRPRGRHPGVRGRHGWPRRRRPARSGRRPSGRRSGRGRGAAGWSRTCRRAARPGRATAGTGSTSPPTRRRARRPFRDVTRQVLFDDATLDCQLRYFEVAPGGWSTLERHQHVHAVLVLRGRRPLPGRRPGLRPRPPRPGQRPAATWHQFRAGEDEPLGFLCLVNADRDRPQLPGPADLAALAAASPEVAAVLHPSAASDPT